MILLLWGEGMISIKELKSLEFSTIDEYFNYIIESEANGQFTQVKELIKKLSDSQYKDFLLYLYRNDKDITLIEYFMRVRG